MFRKLIALGALAVSAATASAQPSQVILSPGVMPANSIGPGILAGAVVAQNPGLRMAYPPPVLSQWQWEAIDPYNPRSGLAYPLGAFMPPVAYVTPPAVSVLPATSAVPASALVGAQPSAAGVVPPALQSAAKLTLQFPSAAEVWLDGKKVKGDAAEERVLESPELKVGEQYTFLVKARWGSGGKTYEAKRAVTLGPGERSRLMIVSGDEMRE